MKHGSPIVVSRKLLILSCLVEKPMHGYELISEIERQTSARIGPGTIYALLSDLEDLEFVSSLPRVDRRTPFELTASGRQYLSEQLDAVERFVAFGKSRLKALGTNP